MRRPVIGITTYREQVSWGVWARPADVLGAGYADAVLAAGGAPVLLPPLPEAVLDVLPRLDGLVLAGGADVDPVRYGAARDPATGTPRTDRDEAELRLAGACLDGGTALLAVCRGMQVLGVALGSELVQHLPAVPGALAHAGGEGVFAEHRAEVEPDSLLHRLVGPAVDVHCHHHQALGRLGAGLRPTAWTADGVVEAVEVPGASGFVLGVQSHPEESADLRLFRALVDAAR